MTDIIVVEDNSEMAGLLCDFINAEGYSTAHFTRGEDALSFFEKEGARLAILDVMLPDGTGYDVCAEIRRQGDTPVIFLTACDDELHTVLALENGADDYISKPFRIRELMARIKAVLRRTGRKTESEDMVKVGSNDVNIRTGKVFRGGKEIILTAMEYKLLLIFINNRGAVLSRQQMLHNIWDVAGDYVTDNTLTVYVKRLREKLEDGDEVIQTVRGLGYRLI